MTFSQALDNCIAARKEFERAHGSPDDYNGIMRHPDTGVKMRLHAYSEDWWNKYEAWADAWDDLMARRFK